MSKRSFGVHTYDDGQMRAQGGMVSLSDHDTPPPAGRYIVKVQRPLNHSSPELMIYTEDKRLHVIVAVPAFVEPILHHMGDKVKAYYWMETAGDGQIQLDLSTPCGWQSW